MLSEPCLFRGADFHGPSHRAAMVFRMIASKQFPAFEIAPHRLQFIRQVRTAQVLPAFAGANRPAWLDSIKSEAGFRKVAGIELTLLDWAR